MRLRSLFGCNPLLIYDIWEARMMEEALERQHFNFFGSKLAHLEGEHISTYFLSLF